MQRELTDVEREWVESWIPKLPMYLARETVYGMLGGLIKPATLNYHDCRGTGPRVYYKAGRKVIYETAVLLEWIAATMGITRFHNLEEMQAGGTERQRRRAARKGANARSAESSGGSCAA